MTCTHLLHIVEVRLGLGHLSVQLLAFLVLSFGNVGQSGYGIFAFSQTLTKCVQFALHKRGRIQTDVSCDFGHNVAQFQEAFVLRAKIVLADLAGRVYRCEISYV